MRARVLSLTLLVACASGAPHPTTPPPATTPAAVAPPTPPPTPPPPPPPPPVGGPVGERAAQLRRAAELLEEAQRLLDAGERSRAELQFSTAELVTGPEALAALAGRFRAGAPPRITTPLIAVPTDQPPQPTAVGNSDDEDDAELAATGAPPPPPERGALTGTVTVAGAGDALTMITLEPLDRAARARRPKQRVMEQRGRQFSPRLMIIPVGSTVAFPNFDPIFHNVFSTSAPSPFDLGLFREGEARATTFDREGIVRLGCNIHANMAATIVVVGAPHYVIADRDGGFRFKRLAPGRYRLRAWSDRSRAPITQELTIRAGANTVAVGVTADAPAGPSSDKFGAARAGS